MLFLFFRALPGDGATALDLGAHRLGEFVEFLGILFAKVGGLKRIVVEVIEFPWSVGDVLEELPGPASHGPRRVAHVFVIALAPGKEDVAFEGFLRSGMEERKNGFSFDATG